MFRLNEVFGQLSGLAAQQVAEQEDRAKRRVDTVSAYGRLSDKAVWLLERIKSSNTPLQVCEVGLDLGSAVAPEPAPDEYALVASDGSQIYPDRHGAAIWFVVNTGEVTLRYGAESSCTLASQPRLYSDERDVFRGVLGQRQSVTTDDVAVVRTLEELRTLLRLAETTPDRPLLALLDGKLIPWSWAAKEEGFQLAMLREYAILLARFREIGVPVASYVSRSGANEVTNVVRLGECDQAVVCCDGCPHVSRLQIQLGLESMTMTVAEAQQLPCGRPAGLVDSDLFGEVLAPGERSPLFLERNSAIERIKQRAAFFYVKVAEQEIARVEMPEWVADDVDMVSFVHAVVADQIAKGRGYPVALREAHEQAIVRSPDRQAFIELLERELVRRGRVVGHSQKARSKERPPA